jgi:predicted RecA/RadA family phage recombinase
MNVKSIAISAAFLLVGSMIGVAICGYRAGKAATQPEAAA